MRAEGLEALRARLRRDLSNARWLAETVGRQPGWRVLNPVVLQTVCVRHEPKGLDAEALDAYTLAWCDRLNRSGRACVTPALLDGRWMVRISIGSLATERAHVEDLWADMKRMVDHGHG